MFVDTNVLVKARILEAPEHITARASLERAFSDSEPIYISRQILREYLAGMTRPQTWLVPITRGEAIDDVERLAVEFSVLEDTPEVTDWLISLCRRVPLGGRLIHDANIVATMLAHGEHRLLTFNESDFRRFGNHIQIVEEKPA